MNLIFLGAPGAGKGTLADVVRKEMAIPSVSTGNLLREAMAKGTELGILAKKYIGSASRNVKCYESSSDKMSASGGIQRRHYMSALM